MKRLPFLFALLGSCLLDFAGAAQQLPPDLLVDENFRQPPPGHYPIAKAGPNTGATCELTSEGYRMRFVSPKSSIIDQSTNPPGAFLNVSQDFTIETEVRGQGAVGMYWGGRRVRAGYGYYLLQLELPLPGGTSTSATCSVWQLEAGGKWTKLAAAPLPNAAAAPWHTLRVQRQGPQVSYYANGTLVGRHDWAPGTLGRSIGLTVQDAGAEVTLRRLRVWHHRPALHLVDDLAGRRAEHLPRLSDPAADEGEVLVSADGRLLTFFRDAHKMSTFNPVLRDNDIYLSERQPDGEWAVPRPAGWPLNNASSNSVEFIAPDGQEMLVLNQYMPSGEPSPQGGMSRTRRNSDGSWSVPQGPFLARDSEFNGQEIVYRLDVGGAFAVIGKDSNSEPGVSDLFLVRRGADGFLDLATALNLGSIINTPYNDYAPFLAPDGKTLYFSSTGHPGYGGADIFVTRRLDDSWTNWSEPLNLGPAVNTPGNEASFCVTAAGDYAYFVGPGPAGDIDLFRLRLTPESRPTPTRLVRGRVLDVRTGLPVAGARISYERLPAGTAVGGATAGFAGSFEIVLPAGQVYGFRAEAPGYASASDNLDLTDSKAYDEGTQDLYLLPLAAPVETLATRTAAVQPTTGATNQPVLRPLALPAPKEEHITLNNVFFERGKPVLLPGSYPELIRLAQTMQENPTLRIRLDGHTDNGGEPKANLVLSQQRVAAIKTYLVKRGVDAGRLETQGFGDTRPVAPNDLEANKRKNRRVEFVIVNR